MRHQRLSYIGVVLRESGLQVTYSREKVTGARSCYITYDIEYYAMVQAVHHWRHYLQFPNCSLRALIISEVHRSGMRVMIDLFKFYCAVIFGLRLKKK